LNYLDFAKDSSSLIFFNILVDLIQNNNEFKLFFSVLLDLYINNCLISQNYFFNEWFNFFALILNNLLVFSHHPELSLIINNNFKTIDCNSITKDYLSINDYIGVESWLSPSLEALDLIFLTLLSSFFIILYFSYYNSFFKENTTISSDYLNLSINVESEKEISSLDDIMLAVIIISYIFG